MSVVENNFVGFSKSLGFRNIDYKILKFFVSRSTIHISSEIEVFEAIVNWVEHDKNSRIKYMCNLLKMVRLPLLSCKVIRKLIRSNKFCQSCQQCCDHIDEVLSVKENLNKSLPINLQHRCCIDNFTHFNFPSHFATLNSQNGFKKLNRSRNLFETKNFEFCHEEKRSEITLFSSETKGLKQIIERVYNDYGFVLHHSAACIFMDKLYVTGGVDDFDDDETTYCQVYDPETTDWTQIERMQIARSHHSCVVFAGKIVVTGGLGMLETEESVEAYDHFKNEWSYMPDLIERRYGHGSVAMGNKLYVIGGMGTLTDEVFDYVSNKFSKIKPMLLGTSFENFDEISYFRIKDQIVVKCDSKDEDEANVYTYDTNENNWSVKSVDYFKENKGKLMYS